MTHQEAVRVIEAHLLPVISEWYGLEGYAITPIPPHEGGRNVVYHCEREGADGKILRIAHLSDRSREDLLAEVEYVRYLYEHGGSVANVIRSQRGNLLEEITHAGHRFFVCLFTKAPGKSLAENGYRYREGVPLTEYFCNCGKVLGKLHQLSKGYTPRHRRYGFFDTYNENTIEELLPSSLSALKGKLKELLQALEPLERDRESFGMVHFDYSDGNYRIDYETGQITVFDFDNSCFCWYLYDLANLWAHGVGWIQFEPEAEVRRRFMEDYFHAVLEGYRSETKLDDSMLARLPLFLNAVLMEGIFDAFQVMRNNGEEPACDEELSYSIKCLEEGIPYLGFFHEIYSCTEPFTWAGPIAPA